MKTVHTFVVVDTRNGRMLHPGVARGRLMPHLTVEYFELGIPIGIVRAFRLNWPGPITRATFKSRAHGPLLLLSPALNRVLFARVVVAVA